MLNKKALAGTAGAPKEYVEDVFSTYLYTGNGSTQTITNGIDLAGKGGLVWLKSRSADADHALYDKNRGATFDLASNLTAAQTTQSTGLTAFNSDGFNIGALAKINTNAATYASWTFREAPKFFDVVTYTGNGVAGRQIAHNLGSVPGMIIVKRTNNNGQFRTWHRGTNSGTGNWFLYLSSTFEGQVDNGWTWGNGSVYTAPTSTVFTVGSDTDVNGNNDNYVAYLFAHNAGGFGPAGTDNVISCGSYTGNGSGNLSVNLGFEPQFILIKRTSANGNPWNMVDNMRGWTSNSISNAANLQANSTVSESTQSALMPTSTGFIVTSTDTDWGGSGSTYIYMAIRRPMKPPTSGTQVFGLSARTGTGANATVTGGQVDDAVLIKNRGSAVANLFASRLTGIGRLSTSAQTAETAADTATLQANPWDVMDGVKVGTTSTDTNASGSTYINYLFRRATGFFDVVCYKGISANTTQAHNLGAVPELIIVKSRSGSSNWWTYHSATGNTQYSVLNTTAIPAASATAWNNTTPTSSVFTLGTSANVNLSASNYVAYLFATLNGISKVGSYTGNGSSQTINCGFTAGARFVLIKRTDAVGDWYVWDTARGIIAGNDPHLSLNTTAAEVTTNDSVDPVSSGFAVNQLAATNINVTSATYIFLAIA